MKKEGAAWHPPLYHSITLSLQKSKPLFLPLPVKTASAKEHTFLLREQSRKKSIYQFFSFFPYHKSLPYLPTLKKLLTPISTSSAQIYNIISI